MPRKHWKSNISLLNVNTQSISAKKLEFQYMVEDAKPDIIVACETWLKPNINSSEFMPPGYDPPFRNDRADGYGGVMIAIKTGLVAERTSIMSPCEMVGVKIQTAQPHPLVVLKYSQEIPKQPPVDCRRHKPPRRQLANKHHIETSVH